MNIEYRISFKESVPYSKHYYIVLFQFSVQFRLYIEEIELDKETNTLILKGEAIPI